MRAPPSGGPARYARTRASSCITASAAPSPTRKQPSSSQRRKRATFHLYRPARIFSPGHLSRRSWRGYEPAMDVVVRQDQFDAMIQGLRDSADLLERLGRDVAVRRILVDVLGDLLNASMATVRFVASALLD